LCEVEADAGRTGAYPIRCYLINSNITDITKVEERQLKKSDTNNEQTSTKLRNTPIKKKKKNVK
jgi:hypothetical protein